MPPTSEIKRNARGVLSKNKMTPFLAAILLILVSTALSMIGSYVSGINDMYNEMTRRALDSVSDSFTAIYGLGAASGSTNTAVSSDTNSSSDAEANSLDTSAMGELITKFISPLGAALYILLRMAISVIEAGAAWYWLKMSRGGEHRAFGIFGSLRSFSRILVLNIVVSIFTFLWSLLFIVPGIIAALRYSQAIYIAMDHPEYGIMDCIRESKKMMAGYKSSLFILDLSFIGWMILGSFLVYLLYFNIIEIVLIPYMGISNAVFHEKIKAISERDVQNGMFN